jgi:hypothetical protein
MLYRAVGLALQEQRCRDGDQYSVRSEALGSEAAVSGEVVRVCSWRERHARKRRRARQTEV